MLAWHVTDQHRSRQLKVTRCQKCVVIATTSPNPDDWNVAILPNGSTVPTEAPFSKKKLVSVPETLLVALLIFELDLATICLLV
jgi:hypothetical protein